MDNLRTLAERYIAEDDAKVSNVGTLMTRGRRLADAVLAGEPEFFVIGWEYRNRNGRWVNCSHDDYITKGARCYDVREVFAWDDTDTWKENVRNSTGVRHD